MTTLYPWHTLTRCAASTALIAALGWCANTAGADEPNDLDTQLVALQPDDDGPRGERGGARGRGPSDRPPEGRRPDDRGPREGGPDDRRTRDRAPEARDPERRGPDERRPDDRGPEGAGRGGPRGGGPGFGPRGGSDGPGSLDERISRLENKLDMVLSELRMLRRDRPQFGPMPQGGRGGARGFGMAGGPPRGPAFPPAARNMPFPPRDFEGPPGMRRGGPPDRARGDRERDRDDGPRDEPRRQRRDDDLSF